MLQQSVQTNPRNVHRSQFFSCEPLTETSVSTIALNVMTNIDMHKNPVSFVFTLSIIPTFPESTYSYTFFYSGSCLEEIYIFDEVGANLTSPLFPAQYPTNYDCSWIFTANVNMSSIVINVLEFNVERGYDFLTIGYGRNTSSGSEVARLTGSSVIRMIVISGSAVWLRFVSDYTGVNYGYMLYITATNDDGKNRDFFFFWHTSYSFSTHLSRFGKCK